MWRKCLPDEAGGITWSTGAQAGFGQGTNASGYSCGGGGGGWYGGAGAYDNDSDGDGRAGSYEPDEQLANDELIKNSTKASASSKLPGLPRSHRERHPVQPARPGRRRGQSRPRRCSSPSTTPCSRPPRSAVVLRPPTGAVLRRR